MASKRCVLWFMTSFIVIWLCVLRPVSTPCLHDGCMTGFWQCPVWKGRIDDLNGWPLWNGCYSAPSLIARTFDGLSWMTRPLNGIINSVIRCFAFPLSGFGLAHINQVHSASLFHGHCIDSWRPNVLRFFIFRSDISTDVVTRYERDKSRCTHFKYSNFA